MKSIKTLIVFVILLMMTIHTNAQFKNPRNLEFTWKTDTTKHGVDLSEITLVLPKGTFPRIDYPSFLDKESGLKRFYRHEPVVAVEIEGNAKAYPLNMLTTHEISNDTLAGTPILATYCPLCNAAVVFDRRIKTGGKEKVLEFEVSGMLRKSDMVMLDTDTESLWQQFMGEAIVGEHTGQILDVIPSLIISVEEFFNRFPYGQILSNETENEKLAGSYGNNPYVGYDAEEANPYERYFSASEVNSRLPAMERVIDIEVEGSYRIYPFSVISKQGVVNDTYKGVHVVFFHGGETVSVLDAGRISESRSIGSVTVFNPILDGTRYSFKKEGEAFVDDQTGSRWDITGRCYQGALEGKHLRIVPHSNHFAFAWLAFFPDSEIYGE